MSDSLASLDTRAVDILDRLIRFDTVSSRSNLHLIDWIADYLDGVGVRVRLTHNAEGTKANLWATIGPDDRAGLVLSGHTDVVPVDDQPWTCPPFALTRREDRLFGRGTADMKAFIALCLALTPDWVGRRFQVPLHFAFTYDEEIGGFGAERLLADIAAHLPRPRLALIGEPTGMRLADAHKGCCFVRCVVTGRAAHGSSPGDGVNAIHAGADLVGFLQRLSAELAAHAEPGSRFALPYTTLNIGRFVGGVATNVVAPTCEVGWEFRALPGTDPADILRRVQGFLSDDLLPRLRAQHPQTDVRMETLANVLPLSADPQGDGIRVVAGALSAVGVPDIAPTVVPFGTEAGMYQATGIPAVVCGPGHIAQAHQADEFIDMDQMGQGMRFLAALADWAATG